MSTTDVPISIADHKPSTTSAPLVLVVWGLLAAAATAAGAITVERRFIVPGVLLTTTVALIVAFRRRGAFFEWASHLPLPALLAFQALRAPIGMAFLVWSARGLAPVGFASGAGYGDLTVGVLAIGLLAFGSRVTEHPRWLRAWNVLGLIDISLVVIGAQVRFVVLEPASLRGLLSTWFPLLPLFVVPLVLAAHLLMLSRLREPRATLVAA